MVTVLTNEEQAMGLQQPAGIGQRPRPMCKYNYHILPIGQDKQNLNIKIVNISSQFVITFVLAAKKNRLNETVLLSIPQQIVNNFYTSV